MRALCLLLLCVVLLAMMQASYLVVEAKKAHHESHITDDADREAHYKGKHHKKEHAQKEQPEEKEDEDPVAPPMNEVEKQPELEDQKDDHIDIYNQMQGDQPMGEEGNSRSGRRERVSKEERRARKQERQERRKEKNAMTPEEREAKKQNRQEKKQQRQEKKQRRQEKKERKQKKQKTPCQLDTECGDGECCMPSRRGEKFCKPNNRPRQVGDKCISTCACEGELQCFMSANEGEEEERGGRGRRKKKQLGTCKAEAEEGDTPAN